MVDNEAFLLSCLTANQIERTTWDEIRAVADFEKHLGKESENLENLVLLKGNFQVL